MDSFKIDIVLIMGIEFGISYQGYKMWSISLGIIQINFDPGGRRLIGFYNRWKKDKAMPSRYL